MKLSILILTHNRPKLFKRCIDSVIKNLPNFDIEILVNNDSNDIEEVYNKNIQIKYFYRKFKKLGDTYKFLFFESVGEYILFLEDDDYILPIFFKHIQLKHDLYVSNYLPLPLLKTYDFKKVLSKIDCTSVYNNSLNFKQYLSLYDPRYFQLTQIVFKKASATKFFESNYKSTLDFDYNLFVSLDVNTFKCIKSPIWVQTNDGGDNLSFSELNRDERYPIK
tara:strand:+ start:6051 stop:6713 length:663 start_codon:yes stop_codon:yes gene_type:complete